MPAGRAAVRIDGIWSRSAWPKCNTRSVHQVHSPLLVGRTGELDALEATLSAARAGQASVVVVSGEAGIGKTRLAREAGATAASSGMRVLHGQAVPAAAHVPFRPFAEALRSIDRDRATAVVREIELYGPALSLVVPEWSGVKVSETTALKGVPEAILRLLGALGHESGLLLILDDLHWADPDSLAVLEYLADNLGEQRMVVIGTERSDWPGQAASLLADLISRRSAVRVALEPLSEDSVEEMARAALGVESVPAAIVGALRRRAEGVPFLVEEMLSAYVASGGPARGGSEWWIARRIADSLPPSYRDLVRERLDRLGANDRGVVRAAAIVGRTFDWRLLGPIAGRGNEEVLAALRSAVREQLVAGAEGQEAESFSFRHALARETVLADLLPPELAALAARAADVLEDTYPGLPGDWCERAADLRIQAGDRLGASRLLQESGRRALARGALATSEAALQRAHELVADDPMAWLGADELLLEVLSLAGKTERLVELGQRVLAGLDRYLSLGRDSLLRLRAAGLHVRVARAALLEGELRLAREHVDKARELTGRGASDEDAARVDVADAHLALGEGEPRTAALRADRAAASADRLGLPDLLCDALDAAGQAALESGDLEAAVAAFGRADEVSRQANLPIRRTVALVELGTLDRMTYADDRRLREARRLAVSTGAISSLARIDHEIALNYLGLANLKAAAESLESALEPSRAFRLGLLPHVLAAQGLLHALAGRRGEMDDAVDAALAKAPNDPVVVGAAHDAHMIFRLVRGDRDAALDELEASIRVPGGSGIDPWSLRGLGTLLLTVVNDDDDDEPVVGSRGHWAGPALPASRAYLTYAEAVAHGRSGRVAEAAAAFARGDALMPPGWARHHARALVGEAAARYGWGEPGKWASEAMAFFDQVGLRGLASHARAVMRAARVPVPRRGRGTAEVPDALRPLGVTSREVEVLELVGLGLSNDQIGARLFLSPRTVETHVTSLLRKTGTETRLELVAFAGHRAEPSR